MIFQIARAPGPEAVEEILLLRQQAKIGSVHTVMVRDGKGGGVGMEWIGMV